MDLETLEKIQVYVSEQSKIGLDSLLEKFEINEDSELVPVICDILMRGRSNDIGWIARELVESSRVLDKRVSVVFARAIFERLLILPAVPPIPLTWECFSHFGLSPETLLLRGENEYVFLGQIVAEDIQLTERLGSGGVVVAYKAVRIETGETFAIRFPGNRDPEIIDIFRCECRARELLSLRGVPKQHFWVDYPELPMSVCELIDGTSLESDERCIKSVSSCMLAIASVAEIVDEIHQKGLVLGDVKAENLLIDEAGEVFIADLNSLYSVVDRRFQTSPRTGTSGFLPPEIEWACRLKSLDLAADIYGLGASLASLLSACNEKTLVDLGDTEWIAERGFTIELKPNLSVYEIVLCALHGNRLFRFDTAAEFAQVCRKAAVNIEFRRSDRSDSCLFYWAFGMAIGKLTKIVLELPASATSQKGMNAFSLQARESVATIGNEWEIVLEAAYSLGSEAKDIAIELNRQVKMLHEAMTTRVFFFQTDSMVKLIAEQVAQLVNAVEDHMEANCLGMLPYFSCAIETMKFGYQEGTIENWNSKATFLPSSFKDSFGAIVLCSGKPEIDASIDLLDHKVKRLLRWGLIGDSGSGEMDLPGD